MKRRSNNIEDIRADIKACAEFHGFKAEETKYAVMGLSIATTDNVSVDAWEEPVWDWEKSIVTCKYTFTISIRRMGGQNSADDIRAMADEMQRVAALVDDLNNSGYELIIQMPKKAE